MNQHFKLEESKLNFVFTFEKQIESFVCNLFFEITLWIRYVGKRKIECFECVCVFMCVTERERERERETMTNKNHAYGVFPLSTTEIN